MKYTWNIRNWLTQYNSPLLRDASVIALMYSYIKPVSVLFDDFTAKRADIDRKLKHNSQQLSFAAVLNDLFDPTIRRITVATNDDVTVSVYIYNDSEEIELAQETVIYNDTELGDGPVIYNDNENSNVADIIIHVPSAVIATQLTRIVAEVNRYRLAGKTFLINPI